MKVDDTKAGINWNRMMIKLERQASSTIEAFLLEDDDPRVLAARKAEWRESKNVEWTRCQSRHTRERFEGELGEKRPLTNWIETGQCLPPDHWWKGFLNQQTHRVHDTIDVNFLKRAKNKSRDSTYKAEVWDLSQNVDRQAFPEDGLTGCLTPSGCAFLTCRGGPIIGVETLKLQGLPVDDIMLSCESEKQLRDFAGNAMTTTVVGAAMLAALIVATEALPVRHEGAEDSSSSSLSSSSKKKEMIGIHKMTYENVTTIGASEQVPMNLRAPATVDVGSLLARASAASQKCQCEGRFGMKKMVRVCQQCGVSSCLECSPNTGGSSLHQCVNHEILAADRVEVRFFTFFFSWSSSLAVRLDDMQCPSFF
jgi:hypothetical protein